MLPKQNRLNLAKEFARFKRNAKSSKTPFFTLLWLPSPTQQAKIGFVVSKRAGKAVARNRIRRLLREALHSLLGQIPVGFDYIVIASPRVLETNREVLKDSFIKTFSSLHS